MTFEEDKNRCRTGHAQVNLNSMRKIALNKIKRSDEKLSLKKKKFKASLISLIPHPFIQNFGII